MRLDDNGTVFHTIMIAGHFASKATGNGDTIRPAPGWFMFIKDPAMEEEKLNKIESGEEYGAWLTAYLRCQEVAGKLGQDVDDIA